MTMISENDKLWIGKKVFIKLKNSTRCYSGVVIEEDEIFLTLIDIKNHLVKIPLDEIQLLQQEEEK